MATCWIKLVLHPDDPKVAIVAAECGPGTSKAEAYVAMLRWLFWLDANYGDREVVVSPALFRAATGWPNEKLAKAFQHEDVDWVAERDGKLVALRLDTHLSASAKRRAQDATRKADARRTGGGQVADGVRTKRGRGADALGTRREEIEESEEREAHDDGAAVAVSAGDGCGKGGTNGTLHGMTTAQHAVYSTIVARPSWLPQEREWIEATTARGLALRPTSTPAHVRYWLDKAKGRKHEALKVNLAGFVIGKLESPDMALVESLNAQEVG